MLTLLKSVSNKIYIGLFLVLVLAGWWFFHSYSTKLEETGTLKADNAVLTQNADYTEKSAAITDSVVTKYVDTKTESHQTTETLRKEALNEYINKIEPKPVVKQTSSPSTVPDGADRVSGLYERMRVNYCRARPQDTRCNPVSPN